MKAHKTKRDSKRYAGNGRILRSYAASRDLYKRIWSLTDDLDAPEDRAKYHRFLVHIYVSMNLQPLAEDNFGDRKGYVPVYSRLIEKEFGRNFDVKLLDGIIEIKGHNTAWGKTREFRIPPNLFDDLNSIEAKSILDGLKRLVKGEPLSKKKVNLATGGGKNTRLKSKITRNRGDSRDTNTPELIRESIRSFQPCPFNPQFLRKWLVKLRRKYGRVKTEYMISCKKYGVDSPESEKAEREYLKARGLFLNDLRGAEVILNQEPRRTDRESDDGDLIYEYLAAYSVQNSGRITEMNGGYQSASRYFKRAAFRGISKSKMNYDLKSSQAYILLQELEAANIECEWLKRYLKDPNAKEKYAKKVGIPVDLWKECFYALIMGAGDSMYGAPFKSIENHFGQDYKRAKKAHKKFQKIVSGLVKATRQWRDYIFETGSPRYRYEHKGVIYWKNACGMRFKEYGIIQNEDGSRKLVKERKAVKDKQSRDACKRKLAAFILQGQEACFIHHLTILCSESEIPVYKNEHDGIITGNKIPKALTKEASGRSGFEYAILKRKALCSKTERIIKLEYVAN